MAFKVSIKDILDSPFHPSSGGYDPNYVEINGKKIVRVNIIARLVKENNTLLLEDQTGKIPIRSFDKPLEGKEGDVVRVVGKVRETDGEKFVAVEIMRKVDPKELEIRRLEILKNRES